MLVSVHYLVIDTSFDCCWFDYVTSEPAPATVLLRAARQLQITYQLLRDYSQLRLTKTQLSVYYQLLLHGHNGATNIYATTNQLPTTRRPVYENSRTVIMLKLRGVPPVRWCLCTNYDVPPMYQLTYERSLLQSFTTTTTVYIINWHTMSCLPVLLFLSVMMSNSFYYS